MSNIEDTQPIDVLACRVWSGTHWHYPHIERMVAELAQLRQIEADANAAGQITRDGKFARIGMKVWHPKHAEPSECFIEHPEDGFTVEIEEGEEFFYYPVSDCHSTPEAAEAARKETK